MLTLWLTCLLLTLLIEIPVFVFFVRRTVTLRRALAAGAAGTLFTHPFLWFVWPHVIVDDYWTYLASGEILVAAIESVTFFAIARPVAFRRAVLASVTANALSTFIGLLLFEIIDAV